MSMSEPSLGELERDVVRARAKLSDDLSKLRSPATVSTFKHELKQEAVRTKDQVVRNLQSSAQSAARDFVEQLKARAAANPAAALVIGAGVAWRLVRNPPIASVLVAAGLFSLIRTTPIQSSSLDDVDYLAEAKRNLRDQATGVMDEIKERGSAAAADITEQARALTHEAMEKAQGLASATKEQVGQLARSANQPAQREY